MLIAFKAKEDSDLAIREDIDGVDKLGDEVSLSFLVLNIVVRDGGDDFLNIGLVDLDHSALL